MLGIQKGLSYIHNSISMLFCKNIKYCLVFFLLSFAYVHAAVELGVDLIVTASKDEISFKSHEYVFFGGPEFALGPMLFFERPHSYMRDIALGAGMRFGSDIYFELDGGYLRRSFSGNTSTGFVAVPIVGKQFGQHFRISLPMVIKYFRTGSFAKTSSIEYAPYIGWRFSL